MADWISQYTAALDERDAREKAHKSYIDAYTKLADRAAALESASNTTPPTQPDPPPQPPAPVLPSRSGWGTPSRTKSPSATTTDAPPVPQNDTLTRLRADLQSTQRSRLTLETQLSTLKSTLSTLQTTASASLKQTELLQKEKKDLERRLRDRDEEVRQKQRLVESVHDEMAGLELELNMSEQKAERLKGENEELVRRWMERMGVEAERMNVESRWQ